MVACIGDSITAGNMSADWVGMLDDRLRGRGYRFINAGVNGDLAWNVVQRLDDVIACAPDVVVLLIGTNDVMATYNEKAAASYRRQKRLPQTAITLEWYIENVSEVLGRLRAETDARIAVMELPILGEGREGEMARRVETYNEALRDLADAHDATVLPLHSGLVDLLPVQHDAPPYKRSMGPMGRAAASHHILRRSWDDIAARNGLAVLTDHVHLAGRGAAVVADLVTGFLGEDTASWPPRRPLGNRLQTVTALEELPDLSGQVAVVTGGTDGVGRALIDQLADAGARVVLTARDPAKGAAVQQAVQARSGNDDIDVVELDLARLDSVRSAAVDILERWPRLDLLICNAAHQPDTTRTVTDDGFETTFAVNHLGHALLIDLLEERLIASAPSQVLVVASEAHRRSNGGLDFDDLMLESGEFRPRLAYSRSKLANILHARELARHLDGTGVVVRSAHPGGVDTPMMRRNFVRPAMKPLYPLMRPLLISPEDAAAGLLRVALDPALDGTSGSYFELGELKVPAAMARDDSAAQRLWSFTRERLAEY